MHITGHLSVALLRGQSLRLTRWAIAALVLGTLTPDLVDKTAWWMGATRYGRALGHAPVLWMIASLLVVLLIGREVESAMIWRRWVEGAWLHLLADLSNDAIVGWLFSGFVLDTWWMWPWRDSDAWYMRVSPLLEGGAWWHWSPLEVGVTGWAIGCLLLAPYGGALGSVEV